MKKHKRGEKGQTFVMLRHDILDSLAWKSLTPNARAAWVAISRRHNGFNNGCIPMSVREVGADLGISKSSAHRAVCQLIDRKLIEVMQNSGFNVKSGRRSRRFALTHIPLGEKMGAGSDAWKHWRPQKSGFTGGTE
jgi:hypothetical protein